jgi:hypothetical protein
VSLLQATQVVSPLSETKHRKYFNDTEHKPDTERLESSDIVAEEPSVDVNLRGRESICSRNKEGSLHNRSVSTNSRFFSSMGNTQGVMGQYQA